jgi:hypothetical protein
MDELVKDVLDAKMELKRLQESWGKATEKLAASETTLANEMNHRALKSLQSFEHKLTLNCNASKIRVYFWKHTYQEPTENDVSRDKDLVRLVRAFLFARNQRFEATGQIEACKQRIKRRTDRIIKAVPSNRDAIQCSACTVKVNRQDGTMRINKHRTKEQ